MTSSIRIQAGILRAFVAELFQKLGLPEHDARTAADVLVRADLRGVKTHGVRNLNRIYVHQLRSGIANPRPQIQVIRESPVTALVDGDGGLGIVVGVRAMETCIAKARDHGLGVVTVRWSRHFGMASYYSLMCLEHDMIGVALTNNSGVTVVPTFGQQPMLNTNPISIVAPAGEEPPFELDMATSAAATNQIRIALNKNEKIPFGWAYDSDGRPTDDPRRALDAHRFLPLGSTPELGSHKGYGLAVAVDILTGVLAGGLHGNLAQRHSSADEEMQGPTSAHFFSALRVDYFRPIGEFRASMDDMLRALKGSKPAEGRDRVYTHGEIEFATEQERLQNGIPLEQNLLREMRELAAGFDVPFEA